MDLTSFPWYIYAFAAVIAGTFFSVFRKKALKKTHSMQFAATRSLVALFLSLFLIPLIDVTSLKPRVILLIYIASLLATIGIFFMSKSYRHMDLSILAPLQNTKPIFIAILGYLVLGEILSLKQLLGIATILLAAYILEADRHFDDLTRPFKKFVSSRYSLYLLFAVIIFSVTSILDKMLVTNHTDPLTLLVLIRIFIGLNINIAHGVSYGFKEIGTCFSRTSYLPLIVAFFAMSSNLLVYMALKLAYVSVVVPFTMLTTLFVVIIGGEFFHEKNLLYRLMTSFVMIIGVYLLVT